MSFEWKDYLEVADQLIEQYPNSTCQEACARAVISRCYYAVFRIAADYARPGLADPSYGSHETVIRSIQNSPNHIRKRLATNLYRLKKEREQADYHAEPDEPFTEERAQDVYELASGMLPDFVNIGALGQDWCRPR